MVCLAGIERRWPSVSPRVHGIEVLTTSTSTWRQTKRSDVLGSNAPGSRPASHRTWKPLQMPEHEPAVSREALDLAHDRREPRDRADAQVVAVGEAAGDDHRVGAAQVGVGVPQQLGLADAAGGGERVALVARARELHDAKLHWISYSSISGLVSKRSHISPTRDGSSTSSSTSRPT